MDFSDVFANNTLGNTQPKHSWTIVYYFCIRCPKQFHEKSVHREVKRLQYPFV